MSLPGEESPFYRQYETSSYNDDTRQASDANRLTKNLVFQRSFADALETANPSASEWPNEPERFSRVAIDRIRMQWPELDETRIANSVSRHLENATKDSPGIFHAALRTVLTDAHLLHYDGQSTNSGNKKPPHGARIIEEPPYVKPFALKPQPLDQIGNSILLLKTPSNAYRMAFVESIFPNADFQHILLWRQPEATINGLLDGWNHQGFFSYDISLLSPPTTLNIEGYKVPRTVASRYWNFDLPPGWSRYSKSPLWKICTFQWASARQAISRYLSTRTHLPIMFDDILHPERSREVAFQLSAFLDIEPLPALFEHLPLVQTTTAPASDRWKKRDFLFSSTTFRKFLNDLQTGDEKNVA